MGSTTNYGSKIPAAADWGPPYPNLVKARLTKSSFLDFDLTAIPWDPNQILKVATLAFLCSNPEAAKLKLKKDFFFRSWEEKKIFFLKVFCFLQTLECQYLVGF